MRASKRVSVVAAGLFGMMSFQATASARQKTSGSKTAATQAAAKPPAPQSTTIPAGAVEVEPGVFQHTDAKGKKWLYRRTPFGIAKYEPETNVEAEGTGEGLLATEQGDSVRFERKTPFGVTRWTKKKSELSPEESKAWKRASQPDTTSTGPARGKE